MLVIRTPLHGAINAHCFLRQIITFINFTKKYGFGPQLMDAVKSTMMAGAIALLLSQHGGISFSITLPLGFGLTAGIDMLMEKLNQAGAELPEPAELTEKESGADGHGDGKLRKRGKKGRN